jgi:hypothetical protein
MALVFWPRPDVSRATAANWGRIHDGMTINEVEEILGPPGDFRTNKTEKDENDFTESICEMLSSLERDSARSYEFWRTGTGNGYVAFFKDQAVHWSYLQAKDDTAWKRFVRKVTRQWRRWFP